MRRPLTLITFVILLTLSSADVQPSENWQSEIVDDSGWVGIDSSIAVDADDNPHISHYDQENRNLKYAYWDGNSWQNEAVDSTGDVGEESGIVIDDGGDVHISYVDATNGYLKYARKTGDSWSIEIVDSMEGYFTMATAIALDSNEYPHIGYSKRPSGDGPCIVRYACWNGSFWNVENVTTGTDAYFTLDSNDNAHLCFKRDEDEAERIAYARGTSGGWSVEIVDSSTEADGDCGIAVDSNGYAHIAYNGNDEKVYAGWNGVSWDIETIASDVGCEEGIKIAVDGQDRPHIVYNNGRDDENEALEYAFLNGSSWVTEIVDQMGNPSIAIDSLGRPHVSHGYSVGDDIEDETEILKYSLRESTATGCNGDADGDGMISDFELLDYIELWIGGEVTDFNLLEAIDNWAGGSC